MLLDYQEYQDLLLLPHLHLSLTSAPHNTLQYSLVLASTLGLLVRRGGVRLVFDAGRFLQGVLQRFSLHHLSRLYLRLGQLQVLGLPK